MKTVSNQTNLLEIKNSKFYGYLFNVDDVDSVDKIIADLKEEHPKATHYTYAYRINNIERSSDDKEPQNTAGKPMLNILQKQDLTNVLVVVVRYFGGIKLGVGPLTRAYVKTLTELLKNTKLTEYVHEDRIKLVFAYDKEKEMQYLLKDSTIVDKKYDLNITYIVKTSSFDYEKFKPLIIEYEILDK